VPFSGQLQQLAQQDWRLMDKQALVHKQVHSRRLAHRPERAQAVEQGQQLAHEHDGDGGRKLPRQRGYDAGAESACTGLQSCSSHTYSDRQSAGGVDASLVVVGAKLPLD
jgi:hypothetical protein